MPLNAKLDAFFDFSWDFLVCVDHGAHFVAATGSCLRDPCRGESLCRFPVRLDGDRVVATDADFSL